MDPIFGGAGWAGTGVLGLIVGYLLTIHLPKKDKDFLQVLKDKDDQLDRQRKEYTESINVLTDFLMRRATESAKRRGVIDP